MYFGVKAWGFQGFFIQVWFGVGKVQKSDCLTSLLFRRVIFEILTENLRLNASTFDFLSSSSIDVNGNLTQEYQGLMIRNENFVILKSHIT